MFSWIPIHTETAERLIEFENQQTELISLIQKMDGLGLSVPPVMDKPTKSTSAVLQEIDPFTFYSIFNRSLTGQNRYNLWCFLKEEWGLKSEPPMDFQGIPTITPQNAWFFPYQYLRKDSDIPNLWKLMKQALAEPESSAVPEVFTDCLRIKQVGVAKLTTGLFWIAPRRFFPLAGMASDYLEANGIHKKVENAEDYEELQNQVRAKLSGDFLVESHNSWKHEYLKAPSNFEFDASTQDALWVSFRKQNPDFEDFEHPGDSFDANELKYKRKGLAKFEEMGGRAEVQRLLDSGNPEDCLGDIQEIGSIEYCVLPFVEHQLRRE